MSLETKITEYYHIKKAVEVAQKKLKTLNEEIKKELEPGEHQVGQYKVSIKLNKKYAIDDGAAAWMLGPQVFNSCLRMVFDPDLFESAYLRGDIDDETMRKIRETIIIPSLTVDKADVQRDL